MPPLTQSSSGEIVCLSPAPARLPAAPPPLRRRTDASTSASGAGSAGARPGPSGRRPRPSAQPWLPQPRLSAPAAVPAAPPPAPVDPPQPTQPTTSTRTGTTSSRPLTAASTPGAPSSRPLLPHERPLEGAGTRMVPARAAAGGREARAAAAEQERETLRALSRARVTERMLNTRGHDVNPITNSDLYTRTDHFVSSATGHQQSNRGGGSAGASSYWTVRTAKVEEGAQARQTDILAGCVIAINGSTGPLVSNLQMQRTITAHGGRFVPHASSACTHVVARNLSGSKAQKVIDAQGRGARGRARPALVVTPEWVLDSVRQGGRCAERAYAVVEDPSSLAAAFAKQRPA